MIRIEVVVVEKCTNAPFFVEAFSCDINGSCASNVNVVFCFVEVLFKKFNPLQTNCSVGVELSFYF